MRAHTWKMIGALAVGLSGLGLVFWALEKTSLIALAGAAGEAARAPFSVYATLFVGLILVGLAVLFAVVQWSEYLGDHPRTKQLPVWIAVAIGAAGAVALLAAIATHAAWLREQDPIPTTVEDGFILFEVLMATAVLIPLVLVGVRWAPGYKHRPMDA